jgi:serine/threonine protein phosphatase PrpC
MTILTHASELQFDTASVTHQGHVRKFNEDSIYAGPSHGIWLVADGMGGHRDGNIASSKITEAANKIDGNTSLNELVATVRNKVQGVNDELAGLSNGEDHLIVGTTIAALIIKGSHYSCLWAGDSRCYLVRRGAIEQVSRDHTEVQELVDRGVISQSEARTWPRRNVITRAVGAGHDLELEQATGAILPGDCFVLCSDGLTGHVDDQEILSCTSWATTKEACDKLLALALDRGGRDNISIIVVNVSARDATTIVSKA